MEELVRHCTGNRQQTDRFFLKLLNHSFTLDWILLTKSKTALRKVIKLTHKIIKSLKFRLHPTKTYIGKISHGFNFLAYYLDDQKILPSQETIRRFFERASALYEPSPTRKLKKYKRHQRDLSEYQVNEAAPTESSFQATIKTLNRKADNKPELLERLRKYLKKWACWLKCGISCVFLSKSRTNSYLKPAAIPIQIAH